MQLNTGAKRLQQVNPGGPDNSQSIMPQQLQYINVTANLTVFLFLVGQKIAK